MSDKDHVVHVSTDTFNQLRPLPDSLRVNDHMKRGPWPGMADLKAPQNNWMPPLSEPSFGPIGPSIVIPVPANPIQWPEGGIAFPAGESPVSATVSVASPDVVTVGDLASQARGSGARKNAGKFEWYQIPWFALDGIEKVNLVHSIVTPYDLIAMLGEWQQRATSMIEIIAVMLQYIQQRTQIDGSSTPNLRALEQTVRVLEFGAKKYAVGNWAKGMPWSVCFSCAISHLTSMTKGEEYDAESGLPHSAHAMCNLLFLRAYETLYREGDDRIPQFLSPALALEVSNESDVGEIGPPEAMDEPDHWAPVHTITGDHA
jgi:hypothetical protein